jgi:hypothetical protein
MSTPKTSPEQLQLWASGAETPPRERRNLTYERGLSYLKRQLQNAVAQIPEYEVAEVDRAVRDPKTGAVVIDHDGLPKVERVRVSKRSIVAKPWLEKIAEQEATYREFLSQTNDERQDDQEALQKALKNEFGPGADRTGLHREVDAFAREFMAKRRADKAA